MRWSIFDDLKPRLFSRRGKSKKNILFSRAMTVKKRVNLTFFLFFLLSNYCLGSFINLVRTKTEMFYSAFLPKYSLHFASWSHNNTPLIIWIFQEHQLITNRQMMSSWRSILTLSLASVVLIIFYNAQKCSAKDDYRWRGDLRPYLVAAINMTDAYIVWEYLHYHIYRNTICFITYWSSNHSF